MCYQSGDIAQELRPKAATCMTNCPPRSATTACKALACLICSLSIRSLNLAYKLSFASSFFSLVTIAIRSPSAYTARDSHFVTTRIVQPFLVQHHLVVHHVPLPQSLTGRTVSSPHPTVPRLFECLIGGQQKTMAQRSSIWILR